MAQMGAMQAEVRERVAEARTYREAPESAGPQAVPEDNPFAKWVGIYEDDPVGFAADMLDFQLLDYQKAPLIALASGER